MSKILNLDASENLSLKLLTWKPSFSSGAKVLFFQFLFQMGFLNRKELIEENDLVILYVNFNTIYPVYVKEKVLSKKGVEVENIYQTKYGSLKAMDLVGVKYGSKVQLSKGYGFALNPTPELWTKCLPHRY